MPASAALTADLVAALPRLRSYAIGFLRQTDGADDLVQETVLSALVHGDRFEAGSSLSSWFYVIMRNLHYSHWRKLSNREVPDHGAAEAVLTLSDQEDHVRLAEVDAAFARLSPDHRTALQLVAVSGVSYADAAVRCGCAIGTMKSRVNRARAELVGLLNT